MSGEESNVTLYPLFILQNKEKQETTQRKEKRKRKIGIRNLQDLIRIF